MKISELDDKNKVQLIENLWKDGETMWSIVEKDYGKNKKIWQNQPEWMAEIPRRRSKARDNRAWKAMESVISSLCGRPSKPNVINVLSSPDAVQLSSDLQKTFIQKYQDLGMKEKMRRALRWLFLSKFMCFKVIWDDQRDDFDVIVCDSRNVRVSVKATSMYDTKYAIEKIPDILVKDLIDKFPEQRTIILTEIGIGANDEKADEKMLVDNPKTEYFEAWLDGEVIYKFKTKILATEKHPYWDWQGMNLTTNEMLAVKNGDKKTLKRAAGSQDERKLKEDGSLPEGMRQYLFNYFDRPIPPYIFGTMLTVETKPVGENSILDQIMPLQEEIDKRKRQISDNTEMMNGQYKIDTNLVTMTKAEAQAAKAEPRGIWYGKGVSRGVEIVFGKELPITVFNEMEHSIAELDRLAGTTPTFRGDVAGKQETATGRAILREQAFSDLDELINVVDQIHLQIYSWWYQMMKVRYTETHYMKIAGAEVATRIIKLTKTDLNEGIEVKVIPGQILPQDRIYKAQRAQEELKLGIIDPLTYFEETERDNPIELAKKTIMFKISPFLVLNFTEEEMQKITPVLQAMKTRIDTRENINFKDLPPDAQAQMLERVGIKMDPSQATPESVSAPVDKTKEVAVFRERTQKFIESPEFKNLPPDQQQAKIQEIKTQFEEIVKGHNQTQQTTT